jgi:hypothetical protein
MKENQRDAITLTVTRLMIHQTDGTVGFYYCNGSSWTELAATSVTYSIGNVVNGSVVFCIDSKGKHDLVCAFSDLGTEVEWGCYGTHLLNVRTVPNNGVNFEGSGAEIGDGFNNTYDIL